MTFALNKIAITNFRAYKGSHEFAFPSDPGLYFFSGVNQVSKRLGSNGAGKSTFIDAIIWCLYGRTSRGLRSNDIISWGKPTCKVTLELNVADEPLTITRTHKPIALSVNQKPVDQTELETYIGLNYESFMCAVVNAQFGKSFFELSPTEKLNLFSDIMRLDFWLKKSEEADATAKKKLVMVDDYKAKIASGETKLKILSEDLLELRQQSESFEADKAARLSAVSRERQTIRSEAAQLKIDLASFEEEKTEINKQLNALNVQAAKVAPFKAALVLQIQQHETKLLELGRETRLLDRELAGLAQLTTDCPTCHQAIRSAFLKAERITMQGKLDFLKKQSDYSDAKLKVLKPELETHQEALNGVTEQTEALWDRLDALKSKADKAAGLQKATKQRLADFDKQVDRIKAEGNPHSKMIEDKKAQRAAIKVKLADYTATLQTTEADHAAYSYWVKGFKRVRLFIIEQAFQTLEIEVNNSLAQLGMDDWQITFDVERENKSGGMTKGFMVFVQGPDNTEPVKWESWSGGETQRLQLAGDMGLSNLIMQQAGLRNTIEVYDEPSTHLSSQGMMDLASTLHERALAEDKQIWIVDHTEITNFGEFQGIIKVRKDGKGSEISLES